MLSSISPVGEASRGQRWWLTATAYTAASTVAGALFAGLLGGLGAWFGISPTARWPVVAVITALFAAGALDAYRPVLRLPSWRRQVDERWLTSYRGWVYGAGYGAQLGVAVATIIPSAATYVVLVAATLSGGAWSGAAIGATFGAVRAFPLLLTRRVRSPAALRSLHRRLATASGRVQGGTAAGLAVLGVTGTVLLLGG